MRSNTLEFASLIIALALNGAVLACAPAQTTGDAKMADHKNGEIDPVRVVVADVANHIDAKRWQELRALYADQLETDYTSLFGGAPQKQSGDALIDGWRTALAKVVTHHLLGPIGVRALGQRAAASCHVRALHYVKGAPGGEYWEVLGHYEFELAKTGDSWKIDKMKLDTHVQTGNTHLLQEAGAAK